MQLFPEIKLNKESVSIIWRISYTQIFATLGGIVAAILITGQFITEFHIALVTTTVTTTLWFLPKVIQKSGPASQRAKPTAVSITAAPPTPGGPPGIVEQ